MQTYVQSLIYDFDVVIKIVWFILAARLEQYLSYLCSFCNSLIENLAISVRTSNCLPDFCKKAFKIILGDKYFNKQFYLTFLLGV